MSESSRSDSAPAHDSEQSAAAHDRDAKIEQLLLVGLDHYFATQYQEAINVWTRALFLDRSHPRARAYIERARSAMAERQRQSEELLHHGVDAFHRGEGEEARRLLQAAIDGGAPSDEALAVLERLNRFEATSNSPGSPAALRRDRSVLNPAAAPAASGASAGRTIAMLGIAAAIVAAGGYAAVSAVSTGTIDWQGWLPFESSVSGPSAATIAPAVQTTLALPKRGEVSLARARQLAAGGHLREALAALDGVRPTDPQQGDADRLRADIQRQMLALAPPPAERTDPGRR
ncbi:MAG TPA: hypothetical protein VEU08_08725 [Vicinamibacterales bacterium]|nr:hypothetical protein [Vicinamibacterales bacterium]